MRSVKTLLPSVIVSQICSPYSAQLTLFVRKYTNYKTFEEQIYEFEHFVQMVASVIMDHRYGGG